MKLEVARERKFSFLSFGELSIPRTDGGTVGRFRSLFPSILPKWLHYSDGTARIISNWVGLYSISGLNGYPQGVWAKLGNNLSNLASYTDRPTNRLNPSLSQVRNAKIIRTFSIYYPIHGHLTFLFRSEFKQFKLGEIETLLCLLFYQSEVFVCMLWFT